MSRFPAVLPISFTITSNSLPLALPAKFGHESIDSGETVTAETSSAATRYVYADTSLSVSASSSSAVDRLVTADDAGTFCQATLSSTSFKSVYADTSVEVGAGIPADSIYIPSENYSAITVTAEFDCAATILTSVESVLDVDALAEGSANSAVFVSSYVEVQAVREFDLYRVANVDCSLSATSYPFSSLELDARAATNLAAGPVAQSLIQNLALASADPLLVTVARSSAGRLTAYISSITNLDAYGPSSEIQTAVSGSSTTVVVQLDSVANTNSSAHASRAIAADIVSQIRAQLVGEAELHVFDVPATFIGIHQLLDSSTLVDFHSFAIGTLPLIFVNVPVDIRETSVDALSRYVRVPSSIVVSVSVAAVDRDSVVVSALRDSVVVEAGRFVSVAAEGDTRIAPVVSTIRLSNSLFA